MDFFGDSKCLTFYTYLVIYYILSNSLFNSDCISYRRSQWDRGNNHSCMLLRVAGTSLLTKLQLQDEFTFCQTYLQTESNEDIYTATEHGSYSHKTSVVTHGKRRNTFIKASYTLEGAIFGVPLLQISLQLSRLPHGVCQHKQSTFLLIFLNSSESASLVHVTWAFRRRPREIMHLLSIWNVPYHCFSISR